MHSSRTDRPPAAVNKVLLPVKANSSSSRFSIAMKDANSVLVIGSGGREHAICWKLSQSPKVETIYVAPGSPAIGELPKVVNVSLDVKNHAGIVQWSQSKDIQLVVVGPEDPLADGIADALTSEGILCFGPGKEAARIEADKGWAKDFMNRYGIPTARSGTFQSAQEAKKYIRSAAYPALVVKASGLAAGKGVVVAKDKEEASNAVDEILTQRKFGAAGDTVVIEELLEGEEVSLLAFTDGRTILPMIPAQDHKRLLEGDLGPNTGGMGAYAPCPLLTPTLQKIAIRDVLQKAIDGLNKEKLKYVGVLYAGLMLTKSGPRVLEFNCRFGDPETQVILPLLESDLFKIMISCCQGRLHEQGVSWRKNVYSVGVVMASKGYPETSTKGCVITGVDKALAPPSQLVFHSGTARNEQNQLITNGGRVLIAVALSHQLASAVAKATNACRVIQFDGAQYRKDIAFKGIIRSLLADGQLSYKSSGVDISAGDSLVNRIKPVSQRTTRAGCLGGLGGFGGLFDPRAAGYIDPLLVSGTDGVGTKLKIAQAVQKHSTIGIDLVAMCVNDILANGAEPLYFLDYFACGKLDVKEAAEIIQGVAEGCLQAGCSLIGGETAEMPGVYAPGDYDLAGFAVGAVERDKVLPRSDRIVPGDVVIGLPSSGVHSNGFSLVRKVMEKARVSYNSIAPFSATGATFGEELLTPTRIYVKTLLPALRSGKVKALAHITGGGLTENIPRILPAAVKVTLDGNSWQIPPVFHWLAAFGGISQSEMLRTFNCGVGIALVVAANDSSSVLSSIQNEKAVVIGKVETCSTDGDRVSVIGFEDAMEKGMRKYIPDLVSATPPTKKRAAVLISGSGTNLQALLDATLNPAANSNSEIVLVISNKPGVEGLKRAAAVDIPTLVIRHQDYPSRVDFDMAVNEALVARHVDLVCLAGFMRVLSAEFVELWRGRLINIHPALLPSFKGTHAHRQALAAGVRITGCTVHFVEAAVDAGGVIVQEAVPIELTDTEESLIERVKVAEHKAYPLGLELVATGKVSLSLDGKVIWRP